MNEITLPAKFLKALQKICASDKTPCVSPCLKYIWCKDGVFYATDSFIAFRFTPAEPSEIGSEAFSIDSRVIEVLRAKETVTIDSRSSKTSGGFALDHIEFDQYPNAKQLFDKEMKQTKDVNVLFNAKYLKKICDVFDAINEPINLCVDENNVRGYSLIKDFGTLEFILMRMRKHQ